MTTHLFLLKDSSQQQTYSLFLPRSVKRLNVKEELKSEKLAEPYICFVEQSGMVVIISYAGICLKYTISIVEQNPQIAPTQEQP